MKRYILPIVLMTAACTPDTTSVDVPEAVDTLDCGYGNVVLDTPDYRPVNNLTGMTMDNASAYLAQAIAAQPENRDACIQEVVEHYLTLSGPLGFIVKPSDSAETKCKETAFTFYDHMTRGTGTRDDRDHFMLALHKPCQDVTAKYSSNDFNVITYGGKK